MLVVHVSSTCDVCCDPLSSSNECAKAPYSISCGHVFYRACLLNIPPDRYSQHKSERRCPTCRASYTNNDIHKLQLGYSSNSNSKPNRRSELDEEMELVRAYIDHFAPEKGQPRGDEKRWTALIDTVHERKLSGKSCSYFDRLLTLCSAPTKANVDTAAPRSINGSIKAPGSEAGSNHSAHSSKHGNDRLPHSYEDSLDGNRKRLVKYAKHDYSDEESDEDRSDSSNGSIYDDNYRSGPSKQYRNVVRFERTPRIQEVNLRSWEGVHVSGNASRSAYYGSEFQVRYSR